MKPTGRVSVLSDLLKEAWSRIFRSRRFYVQLVGSTLALALAPVLIVSAVLFLNTQTAFETQVKGANLRYLRQTINAFEIVKDQIDSSFKQLILDNTIASYESFPQAARLERALLSGDYDNGETVTRYLEAKDRVYNKINGLMLSNRFIESVYYYDAQKRIVLTHNWAQFALSGFFDPGAVTELDQLGQQSFAWHTRWASRKYGPDHRVITVLLPSFRSGNGFVVNLDADKIYRHIVRSVDASTATSTFVIASDGGVILYDTGAYTYGEVSAFDHIWPGQAKEHEQPTSDLRRGFLVTAVTSPSLNWTFVTRTNLSYVYQHVQSLRRFFYLATGVVLLLILTLAILAAKKLYDPILRLVRYLGEDRHDRRPEARRGTNGHRYGEFAYITSTIDETMRERQRLRERLQESLPAFREKLLRSLVTSGTHHPTDVRPRLAFAGVDLAPEDVTVMAISVEGFLPAVDNPPVMEIRKMQLLDAIRLCIKETTRGEVAEVEDCRFVAIVNTLGSRLDELFRCSECIRERLRGEFDADCTIGIGSNQPSIRTVSVSYREAVEALKHGRLSANGEIIHIQEIKVGHGRRAEQVENRIPTLQDCVKSGETEAAQAILGEIRDELTVNHREGPYRHVQKVLMKLLAAITDSVEEMGGDWQEICPEYDAPFETLTRISDIREVFAWYGDLVDRCAAYFSEARTNRSWNYAEKVMELLNEDCGRTVNLHSVAARLNLNPSYLGRIFKEQVGVNFVDYLTRTRINRSKQLLVETEWTVEEIGKQVGYSNSYYFIKLFRELTGTTPGRYKKHHYEFVGPIADSAQES